MSRRESKRFEALAVLYERIRDVRGAIVELGVASGESLRMWARLVGDEDREIFGFDTFAGFPAFSSEDGPMAPAIGKRVGGETELRPRPLGIVEVDVPCNVQLFAGDIVETLPKHAPDPDRVALVFFDADCYAPTKCGIEVLWPRLSKGGLFVFDEYGQDAWPGETKAVNDFVAKEGLLLERLEMESGPSALVVKP